MSAHWTTGLEFERVDDQSGEIFYDIWSKAPKRELVARVYEHHDLAKLVVAAPAMLALLRGYVENLYDDDPTRNERASALIKELEL